MGRGYDHFFFRARSSVWLAYKFDTDAEYRRGSARKVSESTA
ncbi:hypothetical protein JMJ77_0014131 [Colletotrichum scovillei]|uniref:Uncharacterized protein n=1 Tax=Colletotrichum scovillei TaxID=1209932 RepID=A0A9P7R5C5_9PEZI|nr:hypothetical protein JMJ77_0014131 [Colletotrichum scovillei]KAG7068258.1 hypothetical protein JMJ76_0007948 [Colletotrichum scovillei]